MTAPGRYLCFGVSWDDAGPSLALRTPHGAAERLRLDPGTELSFRVLPGAARHCLGSVKVRDRGSRSRELCPWQAPAERGYQCGPCFARDDLRFMHNSHRSGFAPPGLKLYLAQPHWLYVATFGDGTTKVGTAADVRRQLRLTEQGAVCARYVAHADDGRVVRVLEDLVTAEVGLVQAVRSGAKTAALARPLAPEALDRINAGHADRTRTMLAASGAGGFRIVDRQWARPAQADNVLRAAGVEAYPLDPGEGEHGLVILAMLGAAALVTAGGAETPFLADLGRLKGRRLQTGRYRSALPALQPALF